MPGIIDTLAGNLLVPTILFFALGLGAIFWPMDQSFC